MANEILAEWEQCEVVPPAVWVALARRGVDLKALGLRWCQSPHRIPRRAAVVYLGNGAFEFAVYKADKPCVGALIFPVLDHLGDLLDLCAWSPPRPPALWCARGCMLGCETLFRPRLREELPLFRNPLGWMRNGCFGAVILDTTKVGSLLRRAAPLQAEDEEHGEELAQLLRVPPTPIYVPLTVMRAA
jgi:hypothetical protein